MQEWLRSLDQSSSIFLNHWLSPWLDSFMIYWSSKIIWIPLYAVLIVFLYLRFGKKKVLSVVMLLLALIFLSDQTASAVFKPLFQRLRPCHDTDLIPLIRLPDGCGGRFGFASSHAANSMALAVFFLLLPVRNRSRKLAITLIIWSVINGWSRIYLGMHYVGDVVCGFAIGAFYAALIHWLARRFRIFDEKFS
jgi:undecaprenyl-diphosphatase